MTTHDETERKKREELQAEMVVSRVMRKLVCRHRRIQSAGGGDVLAEHLQMFHAHVLFAAPLGTGYMAQPGTDQH